MNVKPWWILPVAALFGLLVGYGFAAHLAPDKVKTVEVQVESDKSKETIRKLLAQVETLQQSSRVTTVTIYSPTTGKPLKTTTEAKTETTRKTDTSVQVLHSREAESSKAVTKAVEVERSRPAWRLTPMAGIDLRSGAFSFGGMISHRLVGPISVGAFGLSSGTVGVGISLEF